MAGPNDITNTFSQMVSAGVVDENVWSLCINHGSTSNGSLTLGGIDERLYTGDIKYTPSISGVYYAMAMKGGLVGNTSFSGLKKDIIIDTGEHLGFTFLSYSCDQEPTFCCCQMKGLLAFRKHSKPCARMVLN